MPAVRKYWLDLSPPVGYSTRHSLAGTDASAVVGDTIGLPAIVATGPSSRRRNSATNCRRLFCCSSSFRSCSRITLFSARISVTSLSRLVGVDCGFCARAELGNEAKAANRSALKDLTAKGRIRMAGFSDQVIRIRTYAGAVDHCNRSWRRIERDSDSRCFSGVGMNPVIEPARKYHQHAGLRVDSKRLPIWVAWRGDSFHSRARIEELQNAAELPIRSHRSGIHVIHTGPRTVGVRVRRMISAGRQMVTQAEAERVPWNESGPAVAWIIRRSAQVTHVVNAVTVGSGLQKKSGRECQPPMLLRPRLGYAASSARISACKSRFIASASGM